MNGGGWFHSDACLYFRRREDGAVEILHLPGAWPKANATPDVVLGPSAWASVVAHVSAAGEDAETHAAALAFHGRAK